MQSLGVSFPFCLWFLTFTSQKGFNNVYALPSINVQTSHIKVWNLADGTSMVSVHPPMHQPMKIFVKEKTVHC